MVTEKIVTLAPVTAADHQYHQMARAIDFLYEHFREQPSLDEAAAHVHMSPYHFQRTFTEWAGISPKRFLQFLTTGYLKEHLTGFDNLLDAADAAGLSSQSRVYDLFVNLEAVTPQEYREKGAGIVIEYGFHDTPFGECIIGITDRGICYLAFLQNEDHTTAIMELKNAWENAALRHNDRAIQSIARSVFYRQPGDATQKLSVLVKGTNFQVKVWNALLQIPYGSVATYQAIAQHIGTPGALQAVGSAVGANPLAYLIPCHRVIKKNLIIGDYHWGSERKKAILGYEMARRSEVA